MKQNTKVFFLLQNFHVPRTQFFRPWKSGHVGWAETLWHVLRTESASHTHPPVLLVSLSPCVVFWGHLFPGAPHTQPLPMEETILQEGGDSESSTQDIPWQLTRPGPASSPVQIYMPVWWEALEKSFRPILMPTALQSQIHFHNPGSVCISDGTQ